MARFLKDNYLQSLTGCQHPDALLHSVQPLVPETSDRAENDRIP